MSFEFLSEMALSPDEREIDEAVHGKGRYSVLEKTPWSVRGQVLATGLAHDDSYVSVLKNGRREIKKKGIPGIKGYPKIVQSTHDIALKEVWNTLFLPQPDQLKISPLYSILFRFDLRLKTPFYSRDDLAFYPIENMLKREWVFNVPYLSAAGVKGLLRWAWQMCLDDDQSVPETRLFGPRQENMNEENARQGCIYTYPLFWKGSVGLDVINPHDRETGTGINPIKYEIVKQGGKTSFFLLIVNREENCQFALNTLKLLEDPLTLLLEQSGLSAKRSSGWGDVDITTCTAWISMPAGHTAESDEDIWKNLADEQGNLKPIEDTEIFPTKKIAELTGKSNSWVRKNKTEAREMVLGMWEKIQKQHEAGPSDHLSATRHETAFHEAGGIQELMKYLRNTLVPEIDKTSKGVKK